MTHAGGGYALSDRVASGVLFATMGGGRSWVVGWGVHMCTQAQPSGRDRTRGAPDQALGTSPGHAASFKVKLKESEKSKLEPGLPGHHESILGRAEGEKTLYLIVYLANGL